MNQRPRCRRVPLFVMSRRFVAIIGCLSLATIVATAHAENGGTSRRGFRQPLDGPNVISEGDLAAGSLVDSIFSPLAPPDPLPGIRARALGVEPSKAAQRSSWSARLARNPQPKDGNPPYVLIDKYGGIQRYVETTPQIDLEKHVGQTVAVRRDTGHTLLADQLDLPRTAPQTTTGKSVRLAAADEPVSPVEPTPADDSATAAELPAETSQLTAPGEVVEGQIADGQIIEGDGPVFEDTGHPMVVPDGVDPLYMDEGPHFGGCDCGDALCTGCGHNPCARPIFYARGEYLLWWFDGMDTPPLVVSSPNANFTQSQFIYGNNEILDGSRDGGRITLGFWADDCGTWGIEGDFLAFSNYDTRFVAGDPTNSHSPPPFIGRPFFNVIGFDPDGNGPLPPRPGLGVEEVETNNISGTVTVNAESEFRSAGVRFTHGMCCLPGCNTGCGDCVDCGAGVGCGTCVLGQTCGKWLKRGTRHTDVHLGLRWAELDEGLTIQEDLVAPPAPAATTATFLLTDSFSTNNQFVGGELGFLWEWMYQRWSLECLSKLAIGNTRQQVSIRGSTVFDRGTPAQSTETGGLLALSSNIGNYERDQFSMIPEVGVTAGYLITDRMRLTLGYTLLYWSNVVRPGDQIDFQVNPTLIPRAPGTPSPIAGDNPRFEFQQTDLWAQGLNVGLDYRY